MRTGWRRTSMATGVGIIALIATAVSHGPLSAPDAEAGVRQQTPRDKRGQPKPKAEPAPESRPAELAPAPLPADPMMDAAATAAPALAPPASTSAETGEKVEADVSARSVAIELGFSGTEIIVFGSVDNSRQPSAGAGYYDVIVALEGQPTPLVVRRKSNVAGLWMNTPSLSFTFDRVPSFYAIASTRPISEIAEPQVLATNSIGFEHVKIRPKQGRVRTIPEEVEKAYRDAVVRLKQKEGVYIATEYNVSFIGRSLFRTTIELPANVTSVQANLEYQPKR